MNKNDYSAKNKLREKWEEKEQSPFICGYCLKSVLISLILVYIIFLKTCSNIPLA